jgi:hypothetical protein
MKIFLLPTYMQGLPLLEPISIKFSNSIFKLNALFNIF